MEEIRNLLNTYAYNILGSYEEAKDIVQDAYLKTLDTGFDNIENKRAYLIRTVINLSINRKKRLRKIVAEYPGEWLPEPVETENADTAIIKKEILSYSLMVLLEKLNVKQRAVFILKEAFEYDHKEIASVLNITEENSRKLFSRAKLQLKEPAIMGHAVAPDRLLDRYVDVIAKADTEQLERLLKNDVIAVTDGGGKASAASRPVLGNRQVIKYIMGVYQKFYTGKDIRVVKIIINHQPALLYYKNGELSNCQVFDIKDGVIAQLYVIRNPDKLHFLEKKALL